MSKPERPIDEKHIACEICLKEVPESEAASSEAQDYVTYFCGLECYELWRKQAEERKKAAEAAGAGVAQPSDKQR